MMKPRNGYDEIMKALDCKKNWVYFVGRHLKKVSFLEGCDHLIRQLPASKVGVDKDLKEMMDSFIHMELKEQLHDLFEKKDIEFQKYLQKYLIEEIYTLEEVEKGIGKLVNQGDNTM